MGSIAFPDRQSNALRREGNSVEFLSRYADQTIDKALGVLLTCQLLHAYKLINRLTVLKRAKATTFIFVRAALGAVLEATRAQNLARVRHGLNKSG